MSDRNVSYVTVVSGLPDSARSNRTAGIAAQQVEGEIAADRPARGEPSPPEGRFHAKLCLEEVSSPAEPERIV
jgi:hypothetical protein